MNRYVVYLKGDMQGIELEADNFEVNKERVKFVITMDIEENGNKIKTEVIVGYFLLDKIIGFIKL